MNLLRDALARWAPGYSWHCVQCVVARGQIFDVPVVAREYHGCALEIKGRQCGPDHCRQFRERRARTFTILIVTQLVSDEVLYNVKRFSATTDARTLPASSGLRSVTGSPRAMRTALVKS
jgi:hypothetical protein